MELQPAIPMFEWSNNIRLAHSSYCDDDDDDDNNNKILSLEADSRSVGQ
jgi:hypothetical protein